jgi:hypothetical protein
MSEPAKALVQKLVEAGEWPAPALLEEILAQGPEAVGPLLEVVQSRPHGWPAEAPLDHAVILLCILRPPEALQPLVELLRHYHNETAETVSEHAWVFEGAVIEPALEVLRDAGLIWYSRSAAGELAIRAAGKDPNLRGQVAAALRELLAQYLARAPEVKREMEEARAAAAALDEEDEFEEEEDLPEEDPEDEGGAESAEHQVGEEGEVEEEEIVARPGSPADFYQMASCVVTDLAMLADPQARDLIDQAYKADLVDPWMIGKKDVALYYKEGGQTLDRNDPRDGLERYRESYEEHLADQRRQPLELREPPPLPSGQATPAPYEEAPLQPFVHEQRKPGRNEPCWCGSGKKYKNCHMREDRK